MSPKDGRKLVDIKMSGLKGKCPMLEIGSRLFDDSFFRMRQMRL